MSRIDEIDLTRLVSLTRNCGFDFHKVAEALSTELSTDISAAECRLRYASTFIVTEHKDEDIGENCDVTDDLSFHEIMQVIENRNQRNERRKEKVFNKVLAALGSAKETTEDTTELQLIKTTIEERKRKKEREQERTQQEKKEREEVEWLARERDRLKQRNQPGSIDAEGEVPQFVMEDGGAEKKMDVRTITEEGEATDVNGIIREAVDVADRGYDFDIEKVFGDGIDLLLEQMEKELEAQAVAKPSIDDTPSELAEVLQFLDAAAASSSKNKTAMIVTKEINTGVRDQSTKPSDPATKENNGPSTNATEKSVLVDDTSRCEFNSSNNNYNNNNNNNNKDYDDDDQDDDAVEEDWKDARTAMKNKVSSLMSQPSLITPSAPTTISPSVGSKTSPFQGDGIADHSQQQNLRHVATCVHQQLTFNAPIEEESIEAVEVTGILALRRAREGGQQQQKRPPRVLKSS